MRIAKNSVRNALAAAALVVICSVQVSLAGYQNYMNPTNPPSGPAFVGWASASLGYSATATNLATTPQNVKFNPSAGVSVTGIWTASNTPPFRALAGSTSQIYVNSALPGGPKVVVYGYAPSGGAGGTGSTDPSTNLTERLSQDGFVLQPYLCGAGYNVASGEESINGQSNLVVLGTSTPGTAHWFRGYIYNGTPTSRDDIVNGGTKLYDIVVLGPFNFGDPTSPDRCNALKIPINYTGPDLYLISDGGAVSTTDLVFQNCPTTFPIGCGNALAYPMLTTGGGCGAVNITFNPPNPSTLGPGSTPVTATATDAAGNVANCNFTVTRPYLTLGPNGFASPIGGTGGNCSNPVRVIKGGSTSLQIKFTTYLCNTIYNSTTAPAVTITQLYDPVYNPPPTNVLPCTPSAVVVNQQQLALTSNTWHWQWSTGPSVIGYYQITVNLGDGNPNPISATVLISQ